MRVLIVTAGSHGDVNPFIAIARALRARGHDATLLVNPYFRAQVEEAGVAFEPLGEYADLKKVGDDYPDIMHPRKGVRVVVDALVVPTARESYQRVHELAAAARPDVVLHHFICLGAAWAAADLGIPCAHAVLAPLNWISRHDQITPTRWSPLNSPRWFSALLHKLMLPIMARSFDAPLAALRQELRLAPQKNILVGAMRGGALNLGMWSPHFRGPKADDPAHGVICGFPWHDRHSQVESNNADLSAFLDGGEPPILFCLGTAAVYVAGDFYSHAAEACRMLGRRGLLLIGPGVASPAQLPPGVRAFAYAPFSTTLPRCAVNVHHGGVGSTGQALRAGRPTVIIPHAHDQFDNAARVKRLGVSETLVRPRVNAKRLAAAIGRVLNDPAIVSAANSIGQRMAAEDGAAAAVTPLERLVARELH